MNDEEMNKAKELAEKAIEQGLIKRPEQPPVITPAETPKTVIDVELTAEKPTEMEECQHRLINWVKGKTESIQADYRELNESYEMAQKQRWKSSTLKRHRDKAASQLIYYQKMLGALEAGYVLVPNMPGAIFAVRTDKTSPRRAWTYFYTEAANQKAKTLPAGEGDYVAGTNVTHKHETRDNKGNLTDTHYQAIEFGELEFPLAMAKPRIMEATSRAMALRIFDEFMILPADAAPQGHTIKTTDPIIMGTVLRRYGVYEEKRVSFMIAWHIDTRSL